MSGARIFAILLLLCSYCGCASSTVHGSVLRTALEADPPTLDAMISDDPNTETISYLTSGFLYRVDPYGELLPECAIDVPSKANGEISPDGLIITYHLRRGLRWQDGRKFTASDVVFSFHDAMSAKVNVPDTTGFSDIKSVRKVDSYTVEVRLKRANSQAVEIFFSMAANDPYPLLPKHLLRGVDLNTATAFNAHPIGMGPFKVRRWVRGDRIVLMANQLYFRGRPKLDRIDVQMVPDEAALGTLWRSGILDLLEVSGARALVETLANSANTRMMYFRQNRFQYILFNHEHVLADRTLRAALVAGLDRERIGKDTLGQLYVRGDGDRLIGHFAYDANITQPRYDPKEAARLLNSVGWHKHGTFREKNGRPLTLVVATSTNKLSRDKSIIVQQQLGELGIDATIKSFPSTILWAPRSAGGILAKGDFDLFISEWYPGGVHDDSYLFRCDARPPNGENFSEICDRSVDRASATELATSDSGEERAADRQLLRRLIANSDILFLGFMRGAVAVRPGLQHYIPSEVVRPGWNAWQWAWSR